MYEPLHKAMLGIARYLDQVCRDNGIQYFLACGTALGAEREGGFIPWDDDFDVMLHWDEYERLMEYLRTHIDRDRFYLQEGGTREWPLLITKLRRNGTSYVERINDGYDLHQGIFVDIWCLEPISDNEIIAKLQWICGRILVASSLAKRNYQPKGFLHSLAVGVGRLIPLRMFGLLLKVLRLYRGKEVRRVVNYFDRGSMKSNLFEKEWLASAKDIDFDGVMLPVPDGIDPYLRTRFGDSYMERPPLEEQKGGHVESYDVGRS